MKLSIVLLTWNSQKFVEKCIDSLYKNISISDYEIILIDNGSTDGTPDMIEQKYPHIRLTRNPVNSGMSVARNQGFRQASGEYAMLLDIDTEVLPGTIDRLLAFMDSHPECGIAGAQLIFPDGEVQKSCRRFPLVHMKMMRRMPFKWAKKLLKSEQYLSEMNSSQPFPVDYVIGACQMIRTKAMKNVGLLDEKIFYGPEDVDFCLRMWLGHWKVFYIPGATIIHHEQRITAKKLLSPIMLKHVSGLCHYFAKHRYCFSRKRLYRKIVKKP